MDCVVINCFCTVTTHWVRTITNLDMWRPHVMLPSPPWFRFTADKDRHLYANDDDDRARQWWAMVNGSDLSQFDKSVIMQLTPMAVVGQPPSPFPDLQLFPVKCFVISLSVKRGRRGSVHTGGHGTGRVGKGWVTIPARFPFCLLLCITLA